MKNILTIHFMLTWYMFALVFLGIFYQALSMTDAGIGVAILFGAPALVLIMVTGKFFVPVLAVQCIILLYLLYVYTNKEKRALLKSIRFSSLLPYTNAFVIAAIAFSIFYYTTDYRPTKNDPLKWVVCEAYVDSCLSDEVKQIRETNLKNKPKEESNGIIDFLLNLAS